jgi:hypothetical protein
MDIIDEKLEYFRRYTSQVYNPLENDSNRAIMKLCLPENVNLKNELLDILDAMGVKDEQEAQ